MSMNFETIKPFLIGKSFSNSLKLNISKKEDQVLYRIPIIESIVKGKKIIHVGCVDHLPLIDEKRRNGNWLHERLTKICNECLGVDINQEGLDYIKSIGFSDVCYLNIIEDEVPNTIKDRKWDYMLLGELLEHIDNPVEFLKNINIKYQQHADKLIITVPNAFRLQNFSAALKYQEWINSDHRYWFSPYTLAKVATNAGFEVESFAFVQISNISWKSVRKKFLLSRYPAFRDCIIMTLQFSPTKK